MRINLSGSLALSVTSHIEEDKYRGVRKLEKTRVPRLPETDDIHSS